MASPWRVRRKTAERTGVQNIRNQLIAGPATPITRRGFVVSRPLGSPLRYKSGRQE